MISHIYGGYGCDERYAEGERIDDFAVSNDMVLANIFHKAARTSIYIYEGGGRSS